MALKYKAVLYEERGREDEYLYLAEHKRKELTQPRPIDSILLDSRCFQQQRLISLIKEDGGSYHTIS